LDNGERISVSKVAGCCAVLVWSTETARLAREHHDAEVVGVSDFEVAGDTPLIWAG
jgi:ribose 5-phosphate isomerase RpiB